jgi:hypothetical protein
MEYVAFIRHSPELLTAYQDTLGDEALGLVGAVLAALAVLRPWRAGDGRHPVLVRTGSAAGVRNPTG